MFILSFIPTEVNILQVLFRKMEANRESSPLGITLPQGDKVFSRGQISPLGTKLKTGLFLLVLCSQGDQIVRIFAV
jgi:hypothetical protein